MTKLLTLILSATMLLSCVASFNVNTNFNNSASYLPYKSVVFFETSVKLKICAKEKENGAKEVKCEEGTIRTRGSGAIVKTTGSDSLVLTAAHVCKFQVPELYNLIFNITILEQKNVIVNHYGNKFDSSLVKVDQNQDVCVVKMIGYAGEAVKMSSKAPEKLDKVFNIGYPRGFYAKEISVLYEGYYSGIAKETQFFDFPVAVYAIQVIGGQSGSMIMNVNGELIGMIHSGIRDFNSMAFSPTYDFLKSFLKDI